MNLQQLRYLNEIVRCGLNISDAANSLYTSQPGVSKQIKLLEEELGIDIFVRNGKRIVAITEPGKAVLGIAQRVLHETENMKQVGLEFRKQDSGSLTIATTHTQARYALPSVVKEFTKIYPGVKLGLHQGSPTQIVEQVLSGEANIGIATESLALYDELVTLPCYEWQHMLVLPAGHPLAGKERIALEDLASEPLITYHPSFAGRARIDQAFAQRKLEPRIVLEAIDSDVITTYVGLGMGLGIVAEMAVRTLPAQASEGALAARPLGHLFGQNVARVAFKRGAYLRNFVYEFAELLSERLKRELVERAMSGHVSNYEL